MQFSFAPGTLDSLSHAGRYDAEYDFIVGDGDLSQLGQQYRFLADHGLDVGRRDVYPAVRTEADKKRAMQLFWQHKVAGWWHFLGEFESLGLCTKEEFMTELEVEVARSKSRD